LVSGSAWFTSCFLAATGMGGQCSALGSRHYRWRRGISYCGGFAPPSRNQPAAPSRRRRMVGSVSQFLSGRATPAEQVQRVEPFAETADWQNRLYYFTQFAH